MTRWYILIDLYVATRSVLEVVDSDPLLANDSAHVYFGAGEYLGFCRCRGSLGLGSSGRILLVLVGVVVAGVGIIVLMMATLALVLLIMRAVRAILRLHC